MTDTLTRLIPIIAERLGVEPSIIKPADRLLEDLGAFEFDRLELIIAIEDAFNVEISDEEIDVILTIADLVRVIETLTKEKDDATQ